MLYHRGTWSSILSGNPTLFGILAARVDRVYNKKLSLVVDPSKHQCVPYQSLNPEVAWPFDSAVKIPDVLWTFFQRMYEAVVLDPHGTPIESYCSSTFNLRWALLVTGPLAANDAYIFLPPLFLALETTRTLRRTMVLMKIAWSVVLADLIPFCWPLAVGVGREVRARCRSSSDCTGIFGNFGSFSHSINTNNAAQTITFCFAFIVTTLMVTGIFIYLD